MLRNESVKFSRGFTSPETLACHSLSVLWGLLQTKGGLPWMWGEVPIWTPSINPDWWSAAALLDLLERPAIHTRISGAQQVLGHVFYQEPFPPLTAHFGTMDSSGIRPPPDLCLVTTLSLTSRLCLLLWCARSALTPDVDANQLSNPQDSNQGSESSQRC